jgi:hypothetical protein
MSRPVYICQCSSPAPALLPARAQLRAPPPLRPLPVNVAILLDGGRPVTILTWVGKSIHFHLVWNTTEFKLTWKFPEPLSDRRVCAYPSPKLSVLLCWSSFGHVSVVLFPFRLAQANRRSEGHWTGRMKPAVSCSSTPKSLHKTI